jgi:hypothetical protein
VFKKVPPFLAVGPSAEDDRVAEGREDPDPHDLSYPMLDLGYPRADRGQDAT